MDLFQAIWKSAGEDGTLHGVACQSHHNAAQFRWIDESSSLECDSVFGDVTETFLHQ